MKIVVLDGYTLFPGDLDMQPLYALGNVAFYERTPEDEIGSRIGDAPVVLTNKAKITKEVMDACPALRYIGVLATGYNVVDIEEASKRGIMVTNVPTYSTQAVAQHTMALLLASMSHIHTYDAAVKRGTWSASPDFCFFDSATEELAGKMLGIIGFGSIGQAVAKAALGLDMRVMVHTRTKRDTALDVQFVALDELLSQSDVISLHCPLTEKTNGLISAEAIAVMKDGVRVINTARGPLVDESAMAQAIESGKVACFMADVLSVEPPKEENPLLHARNTIITPHVAWAPLQTRERLRDIAVGNVRAFMDGAPRNVVNL